MLRKFGLEIDVAVDGRDALERVAAATTAYDAVFMDVQMLDMDGLDATRGIRRLSGTANLPIIAMTANAFEQDLASCLAAGMNDFVAKPFERRHLATALVRWLGSDSAGHRADAWSAARAGAAAGWQSRPRRFADHEFPHSQS